ncbi:hypothetical protein [Fodinibius sp. SL11]|uniref:hypothetical protein n=1 Tax=Fodinibius sp. SL11 TaxID=3425690 RepID=UPI003F880BD3
MNKNYTLVLLFSVLIWGCTSNPQTVKQFSNPASPNSVYPYLFSTGDQLYMSWITNNQNQTHSLNYASYSNNKWTSTKTIATDSTWFINWADFPSIIADQNGPIAAHWLNKKPGGSYAYDVNISTADNSGNWNKTLTPHNDDTPTEHGFASIIPWDEDRFLAVWLDGRKTNGRSDEDYFNITFAMTLRGALINKEGDILRRFLIDDSVCDCCQTSLVKTTDGAMVAYRNRTNNEVRDIYTSRFNGNQWTSPKAVFEDGWEIGACPVNGPKLAAEDSLVVVAWHTGAQDTPTAKFTFSMDSGQTFNEPIQLNTNTSLGRVDAEIIDKNIYLSWMEKGDANTRLRLSAFNKQSPLNSPRTVAVLNESRKTGFPQMEHLENKLIFAWTNADSAQTKIITKSVAIP